MVLLERNGTELRVSFRLREQQLVGRTSVVGPFNDWQPGEHELRKRGGGLYSVIVTTVPAGRLTFRYLGTDGVWFNDPDVIETDDAGNCVVEV